MDDAPLLRVAGGLGVGGLIVSIGAGALACGGIAGAAAFGVVPVALSVAAFTLIVIHVARWPKTADPAVLAAAFAAIPGGSVGLLLLAVWRHWLASVFG